MLLVTLLAAVGWIGCSLTFTSIYRLCNSIPYDAILNTMKDSIGTWQYVCLTSQPILKRCCCGTYWKSWLRYIRQVNKPFTKPKNNIVLLTLSELIKTMNFSRSFSGFFTPLARSSRAKNSSHRTEIGTSRTSNLRREELRIKILHFVRNNLNLHLCYLLLKENDLILVFLS